MNMDISSEKPKVPKFVLQKILVHSRENVFSVKVLIERNKGSIKVIKFIFILGNMPVHCTGREDLCRGVTKPPDTCVSPTAGPCAATSSARQFMKALASVEEGE
jgi:hypothetical protein